MNTPLSLRAFRLREAAAVQRCHTIPHVGEYSVGQHTANMLLLLEALHPAPTLDLYRAVLFHDLHERWIGDLPGHLGFTSPGYYAAKRKAEETTNKRFDLAGPDLVGEEARWLSALDKIEFYMWCHDQLNFGNDHVSEALESTERWIEDNRARLPEPVRQFLESYEWERTNMR